MARPPAALAATPKPGEHLLAWAEMHLADILGDIHALKTSTRIWYHRKDQDPIDVTAGEIARLERRVGRLTRLIERKRREVDCPLAEAG